MTDVRLRDLDEGTGYQRAASTYNPNLVEVGRGTPMGELLRRYWHPVGLSADATDTPKEVRALGEDLILFRDKAGRPGLVHARCCHRGTTLYYGKVEEQGIRCCYHGWLFDYQGRCLEQPCEPHGGARRDLARQPWYPLQERYGLIFAYMGPPEKKPMLPRYEILEVLEAGEFLEADNTSYSSGGGETPIIPCNWTHHFENVLDPFHVPVLHSSFSGVQFNSTIGMMPDVKFEYSKLGVKAVSRRTLANGKTFLRVTEAALPTVRVVANPFMGRYGRGEKVGWVLPIDDTHFRIYTVFRVTQAGEISEENMKINGKTWKQMTSAERRDFPNDYEAQTGQGKITFHSEEHLVTSDQGIGMLRRLYLQQIKVVAAGGDPIGTSFDEAADLVRFEAGNYLLESVV